MPLAALDDSPTLLDLGGRAFRVAPLRVRHLAALERRLAEQRPDPWKHLAGRLAGLDDRQQELLLGQVYDASLQAARIAHEEVEAYFNSREGFVYALWQCIHEHDSALEHAELVALVDQLPAATWPTLMEQALEAMGLDEGNRPGQA